MTARPREPRPINIIAAATISLSMSLSVLVNVPASAQTKVKDDGGGVINALPGCGVGMPMPEIPGPPPPIKTSFASSPGGVDMRSGNFNYDNVDLSIGSGDETGLTLRRIFSYSDPTGTLLQGFGHFFTHNWDIIIKQRRTPRVGACNPGQYNYSVSVNFGALGEGFWSWYSPINFIQTAPNGHAELSYSGSPQSTVVYTFVARDGTRVVFQPLTLTSSCGNAVEKCARASSVIRPDGTVFTLNYDGGGSRLRSVVSNRGYALLFEYSTSASTLISKACVLNLTATAMPVDNSCPAGSVNSTYAYTGNVQTSAAMPAGGSWSFGPSGQGFSLTRPGESTPYVNNTYALYKGTNDLDYNLSVTSQTFAAGPGYNYIWNVVTNSAEDTSTSVRLAGGKWTDSNGQSVTVTYGQYNKQSLDGPSDPHAYVTPGPILIQDELGRNTIADYCGPGVPQGGFCPYLQIPPLQSVTDPEGSSEHYAYTSLRDVIQTTKKAKPGSGLGDIVETRTYPAPPYNFPTSRSKPASITDGRGNTTSYTYDPVHGGVLTETLPAVAVDGAGSVQPVKRYDYTYRKAWISNGAGGYVQNPNGIYLLAAERVCRTSGACPIGAADEVVTTYDYGLDAGPNNLLVRSKSVTAGGVTLRTCYGYDLAGNKIYETSPKGGCL